MTSDHHREGAGRPKEEEKLDDSEFEAHLGSVADKYNRMLPTEDIDDDQLLADAFCVPRESDNQDVVGVKKGLKKAVVATTDKQKMKEEREIMSKYLVDPKLSKMLNLNLDMNDTMDYRRINLTEAFFAFNFDRDLTLTHWRVAKIMDGITMCSKEWGICEGIGATDVPGQIYDVLRDGKASEKTWKVTLHDPEEPDEDKTVDAKASLVDFAQFMDVYELNRSLGKYRMDVNRMIYYFFTGQKEKITLLALKNSEGNSVFEGDDYTDLKGKEVDKYTGALKKNWASFELLEDFRYKCENHRENGGHAVKVTWTDGAQAYVPVSGLMAADITGGDLRKKKGGSGIGGHPHEVAELCEHTGAIIRLNMVNLNTQRRDAGEVSKHNQTNLRLLNMSMGLDSEGKGKEEKQEEIDGVTKKIISLNGVERNGEIDSLCVRGQQHHYNKIREALGIGKLSDKEAADLFVTDVMAPMFLNNSNDWMMTLAEVFKVRGTKSGTGSLKQSIIKPMGNWEDFELRIIGKDVLDDPANGHYRDGTIKSLRFTSFSLLEKYIHERYRNGDIDQHIDLKLAAKNKEESDLANTALEERFAVKENMTDEDNKKVVALVRALYKNDKEYETVMEKIRSQKDLEKEDMELTVKNKKGKATKETASMARVIVSKLQELKDRDPDVVFEAARALFGDETASHYQDEEEGGEEGETEISGTRWKELCDGLANGLVSLPIEKRKALI